MDNITPINTMTTLPVPVDRVLDGAKHLNDVLVIGWEDDKLYIASSNSNRAELLYLLELCKADLLELL